MLSPFSGLKKADAEEISAKMLNYTVQASCKECGQSETPKGGRGRGGMQTCPSQSSQCCQDIKITVYL
jgi:hypothetical protein